MVEVIDLVISQSKQIDIDQLFSLKGRGALVTGAAEGLGKTIALGLASFGANIVITDVNEEGLKSVAEEARRLGVCAEAFRCDNSQPDQIHSLFKQLDETSNQLDILVNNVGIIARQHPVDLTLEDWERVVVLALSMVDNSLPPLDTQKRRKMSGFAVQPVISTRSGFFFRFFPPD